MKPCPSAHELERFLDEQLSDARQHELAEHVGSCAPCQAALERLTESNVTDCRDSLAVKSEANSNTVVLQESETSFLARLKASPLAPDSRTPIVGPSKEKPAPGLPPVSGYEIIGELGRGGMGVVYKARHVALDRLVALKMILAGIHAGPKDQARFRQEAAAVARLHHPNIVQIFDIGDAGGHPYIALEYVEKGSLAHYLRGEPQPLQTSLPLIETLARAMAYAHQCGIVHRDLKPANILLSAKEETKADLSGPFALELDRKYVPKITDFGLAKRLNEEDSPRSNSGEVLGTPSYMAPEQADSKTWEIGPTTDVYALGAILYEMLTGRPPFLGATSFETMLQVMHEEPVRPGRLRPRLPQDIEIICLKCLDKDPARRYGSASALAEDLRRFRRGDPIEARPVGLLERGWKLARRRPTFVALVFGIILVTMLGFTGVTWQWQVAVRERNEQQHLRQQARNSLYFSRIAQSQLQWRVNDPSGALRSLEDCDRRQGDYLDRRGWEWYYLQTLYRPELFSLTHSRGGTEGSVMFDPTGRTIASIVGFSSESASERGEIRIWDAANRNLLYARTLHTPFHRIAYQPDGGRLVLGSTDGKVAVWGTTSYQELWQGFHSNLRVTSVAFHADGKIVASAAMVAADPSKPGEIKLWDAEKGTSRKLISPTAKGGFYSVAFHPSLPLLASGGEDNTVRLWDVEDGKELRSLPGHKSAVNGVAFSPDGKLLVSAGSNGELKIWNLEQENEPSQSGDKAGWLSKGRIVPQSLTGRTGAILSLAFSPDSRTFAYCGTDKTVRVWDVDSGTGTITYRGHTALVESAQFSPDAQRLVSCSPSQGEVKVWDLTRHPEFSTLVRTTGDRDHPARDVENIAFHRDGRHLVSVTVVGELQVWDAISGVLHAQHRLPISTEPSNQGGVLAAFTPDGLRLAARSSADPRHVRVWEIDHDEELLTCRGHRFPLSCLRFSSDGRYLATCACEEKPAGQPFELKVWNAATGELLAEMSGAGRVLALTFSPDGRWLVVGNDARLRVFDRARGKELFSSLGSGFHRSKITALAFCPGGKQIASAGMNDKFIHIWDTSAWDSSSGGNSQPSQSLVAPSQLCDLTFSPDGKRLVGASRDLIKMWDVETGVEVLTLRGAPQRYRDPQPFNARVVFSPNGRRLAGTNWNESISVWDAPMPADDEARLIQEAIRRQGADERALFWHLQEAEYCVDHKLLYGARFHLQRLRDADLPLLLQERTDRIRAKMVTESK